MTSRLPWWLLLLLTGVACGGDTPTDAPTPGELVASLVTPNTQDGALLVRVVGAVTEVNPVGSYRAAAATSGTTTRVVVTGNINGGDLLRFSVPDTRNLNSYTVVVEQVAARDTYALLETSGYHLSLRAK